MNAEEMNEKFKDASQRPIKIQKIRLPFDTIFSLSPILVTTTTAPIDPTTTAPIDPTTTAPIDPTTAAPIDPTTTAPIDPTTTAPIDPTATAPCQLIPPQLFQLNPLQ